MGLDSEWEERLMRWALAVQNALRIDTALPPFPAAGAGPPKGESPASESDSRVRGQMETGYTADRDTEKPQMIRGRDFMSLGRSGVPLTQPSAASAIRRATTSMFPGTEGGAPTARGRRGRPRGSGRGSRPNRTVRGAFTNRGRTIGPGAAKTPPAPGQRRDSGGETEPRRE